MIDAIFGHVRTLCAELDPYQVMKLDRYLDTVFKIDFRSEEWSSVETTMTVLLEQEKYISYFLAAMNYKLQLKGNQARLGYESFASLRSKFLYIISSIKYITNKTS